MSAPLLVIAAGGTGGHMFPAQSLAEEMLNLGWRVKLSTDDRGARYAGSFPDVVEREVVQASTFARGGLKAKLIAPFKIMSGIGSARSAMRKDRPSVVVGFGGYPALPAMAAAQSLGIPRMIHEQNGVLGRVNKAFATRVQTVACSVWPTELPKGARAVHTGNPVRQVIREVAASPYPSFAGDLNILVIGGSQGATILSETVPLALAHLPQELRERLVVSHQARDADHELAVAAYETAEIRADVQPFFEDVPERLVASHLVISRSGASSIADISAVGRPSILVPLAMAIRDEQTANAQGLVQAGAGVLVTENDLKERLSGEIETILGDEPRAIEMAKAATAQGRPDAVDRLKEEVLKLVETS